MFLQVSDNGASQAIRATLEVQKERLASYDRLARFGVVQIYERARKDKSKRDNKGDGTR